MSDRDEGDRPANAARREAAGVPVDPDRVRERRPHGRERRPHPEAIERGEPDTAGEAPRVVVAVGRFGVNLALASLGLAAVGIVAVSAGFQPYGNVALVLALAGVTVAMFLGMAFQAYAGDYRPDR